MTHDAATTRETAAEPPLLHVEDLRVTFFTEDGEVRSVDGVSFDVAAGKTLGVVGESGCGKSVSALSIMRLVQAPGRIVGGRIVFEGHDLMQRSEAEMRDVRGNDISMIFQEPMTSLNPVFTIGAQVGEALALHSGLTGKAIRRRTIEMLQLVGIPSPERRIDDYPHQLSGGMRQRVMIAMALSCNPRLLIADEPTTALDVTIQAQILELMTKLQDEFRSAIVLITHDLGVIAETADEVVVMYLGRIVERAQVGQLFDNPRHPYTIGLLNSTPSLDTDADTRLQEISGSVPSPLTALAGCKFHPRCAFATDVCREREPAYETYAEGHWVRCWHADRANAAS